MISETELIIIVIVALLLFGPDKLPEVYKNVTSLIGYFKSAQKEVTNVVQKEVIQPLKEQVVEPVSAFSQQGNPESSRSSHPTESKDQPNTPTNNQQFDNENHSETFLKPEILDAVEKNSSQDTSEANGPSVPQTLEGSRFSIQDASNEDDAFFEACELYNLKEIPHNGMDSNSEPSEDRSLDFKSQNLTQDKRHA